MSANSSSSKNDIANLQKQQEKSINDVQQNSLQDKVDYQNMENLLKNKLEKKVFEVLMDEINSLKCQLEENKKSYCIKENIYQQQMEKNIESSSTIILSLKEEILQQRIKFQQQIKQLTEENLDLQKQLKVIKQENDDQMKEYISGLESELNIQE